MLVFLFIAVCWTVHPREFLLLTACNRFIQSSGVNSSKHAVQPSPALMGRIFSLWTKRLPAPGGISRYEGRDFRLIF